MGEYREPEMENRTMNDNAATTLIPHLCCRNAFEAAEFYEKAFGAVKLGIIALPNGRVAHAELRIGHVTVYLMDEMPERNGVSPAVLKTTPVLLYLRVPDCDTFFNRAVKAGCEVPLQNMFWGDRYAQLVDPYGHRWEIATTVRAVSSPELQEAVSAMTHQGQAPAVAD